MTTRQVKSLSPFLILCIISLLIMPEGGVANETPKVSTEELLDMSLEDLMNVTIRVASKREETVDKAPGIINVVTDKDIKHYGANNLLDIFNRMPSMQTYASSFAPNNIVSMRGQTFQHYSTLLLFLIDGRPFRDSNIGMFGPDLFMSFPINLIKRIEVIRGPGSVLYGSSAFSGVVNIVTKEAAELNHVDATMGPDGTAAVNVSAGVEFSDEASLAIGAKSWHSDGWEYKTFDQSGTEGSFDREEDFQGFTLSGHYGNLTLSGFYSTTNQVALGADVLFEPVGEGEDEFSTTRGFLDVGYGYHLNNAWSMQYNLTHNYSTRLDAASATLKKPDHNFKDYLFEVSTTGALSDKTNIIIGATCDKNDGYISGKHIDYASYSAYTQYDYCWDEALKLIVGLQLNKPQGFDISPSLRLGLIKHVSDRWTVKFLYGEAFRSPYIQEKDLNATTLVGNPDLDPEEIATYDLQFNYTGTKALASATLYHSTLKNLLRRVTSTDPLYPADFTAKGETRPTPINDSEHTFYGIELDGDYPLSDSFRMHASGNYKINEDGHGDDSAITPKFMAKVGLSYSPVDTGFTMSIYDSFFGTPKSTTDVSGVPELNPKATSYHLASANFILDNVAGIKGFTMSVFVDNLFDEKVYYPDINKRTVNTLPIHPGRRIYLKASYAF